MKKFENEKWSKAGYRPLSRVNVWGLWIIRKKKNARWPSLAKRFFSNNLTPAFLILIISNLGKNFFVHMGHFTKVRSRSDDNVSDVLRNFLYKSTCRRTHTQFLFRFFYFSFLKDIIKIKITTF